MIVICIDDNWYNKETVANCKEKNIPFGDWHPVKYSLYEVVSTFYKSYGSVQILFYELYEDPKRLNRTWKAENFREVEVEIKDIECEIVKEITV